MPDMGKRFSHHTNRENPLTRNEWTCTRKKDVEGLSCGFEVKKKNPVNLSTYRTLCGERGIRTPGTLRYAGFQDRCIRPLYHLSLQMVAVVFGLFASAKVGGFI